MESKMIVVYPPPMRSCWVLLIIDYDWAATVFE